MLNITIGKNGKGLGKLSPMPSHARSERSEWCAMTADLDIYRAPNPLIKQHGNQC